VLLVGALDVATGDLLAAPLERPLTAAPSAMMLMALMLVQQTVVRKAARLDWGMDGPWAQVSADLSRASLTPLLLLRYPN